MLKTYEILLDVEKELYTPSNILFNVSSTDFGTIELTFIISQDNAAFDLTGKTVELAVKKPSGLTVYQLCEVTEGAAGKARIMLDLQAYVEYGVHTAEVYIRDVNQLMVTSRFYYYSRSAVMENQEVESINSWSALQQALFAYDLKPIITSGFPTATPEYIGQMAFDSVNKTTYIANDLTSVSWQSIGGGEGGGGGTNDTILGISDPIVVPARIGQLFINTTSKTAFISTGATAEDWEQIDGGGGLTSVSWADITDKPTSFTPATHTHLWADITDKPTTFTPATHTHTKAQITDFAHTHLWADITNKPTTFAPTTHTHLWADITDKPTTFTPATHTHTKAQITDFSHTHLWADITDKPTTFAPTTHTHLWADITDKPTTFTPTSHTHAIGDVTNLTETLNAKLSTPRTGAIDPTGAPNYIGEIYINTTSKEAFIANSDVGDWQSISMDELGGGAGSVDWAAITNKPNTFPPATHTHLWADITDKPTTFAPAAHTHLWADITDKPTTFTPATHTHTKAQITDFAHTHLWADITDKPTTFAPAAHTHLWADITDKPTTFTPATHTHTKAQITDFSHTHLWADITDKPTTFTPATHTHLWADITDKPTTFTPATHTHLWADITDKPTTFTPATHTHLWADITDKPTTFTPATHTHAIGDVTNLTETLAGKVTNAKGVSAIWQGTQAEYDLLTPDANTLYFITG